MGSIVGDGSTCVVHEAWRRKDGGKVAVKIINKLKWPTKYSAPSDLMKEVNILKSLDHPGIIKVRNSAMVKTKLQILTSFFPLKNQILSAFGIKNAIFQGSVTKNSVILALKIVFLMKIGYFFYFFIKLCFLQWFKN